jgi:glycosyltransferase involved in cell wall biosynthesis
MTKKNQPLVSVVTPVYNGEKYIGECIKSVLNQTYQNWEHIIVNNCSTDGTLDIVNDYSQKDNRIYVHNNLQTIDVISNHNRALKKISNSSKYCKILHADDWIFPQCIELMVRVSEDNPSVGIVGSYGLKGNRIVSNFMPYSSEFLSGRKICRWVLMGKVYPFTRPSSLLIRSEVIRKRKSFYNDSKLHADVEVLYEILRDYDFGFVHQVLTFIREHEDSVTSNKTASVNRIIISNLDLFTKFGPEFLNADEYEKRHEQKLKEYYRFLAHSLFQFREKEFWKFHKNSFQQLGYRFSILRILWTAVIDIVGNPRLVAGIMKNTMRK